MSSLNKVLLMGRLTRDPELRVTPNGTSICKFSVATSRRYKLADGTLKEDVTFHDVDAFGKQAEVVSKFFTKGKLIFIEGRLRQDQWEGQNGEKRSKVVVVLEGLQFIGPKEGGSDFSEGSSYDTASASGRGEVAVAKAAVAEESFDDDVPF